MLNPAEILGPQGRIAAQMPGYEHRRQQLQMANAVAAALENQRHLIVEAGTGVGKSFAYLAPAILAATQSVPSGDRRSGNSRAAESDDAPDEAPRRIVISTHTISLQEQLISKDIPFLKKVIPRKFSAVLVKGRGNYLSRRRMKTALQRQGSLFFGGQQISHLKQIASWAKETPDGSRSDLAFRPLDAVWSEVASDSGNCMRKKCPTFESCFYFRARRRVHAAQILIVNHALFFSDLALRRQNASILPDYQAVIFDEAHTLEAVAGDHLGVKVTSGQVQYILNRIYNERSDKGLLAQERAPQARKLVKQCGGQADTFFHQQLDQLNHLPGRTVRIPSAVPEMKPDSQARQASEAKGPDESPKHPLSQSLLDLADEVHRAGEKFKGSPEKRQDYTAARDPLKVLAGEIETWRRQDLPDAVYWLESGYARRGAKPPVTLAAAPIDVGPSLREQLFEQTDSVIMTSATISIGRQPNFDFFQSRVGLTNADTLRLGSPFDYRRQAQLILVRGMPDPSRQREQFEQLCPQLIQRYVARTDGRAFVLFTSYEMLRRTAEVLSPWLEEQGLALLSQAEGLPRNKMLEAFKANPRSVLMGTDSFWQGVDVPGDALQNVIITKLPFSVPDQPLLEARLDAIRQRGGNPFMEYQVPETVIKLRQGFGRLIRTQQDRGIVVLLDPRVRTKPYGRIFLDSLPECQVIEERVK